VSFVSKRKQRKEAEQAAADTVHQQVASTLGEDEPPLGADILLLATQRYQGGFCPPDQLQRARADVEAIVKQRTADVLVLSGRRRSLSKKKDATALLALLPKATPFRDDQFFVGLYSFAFGFWRDRALVISGIEPGGVPTHLHQRIIQRSRQVYTSLADAQDRFSDLWPCLVEVGERRRLAGRPANVGDFVSPWADGLMFGDFAAVEFPPSTLHLSRPVLFDYDPKRGTQKLILSDRYSTDTARLGYQLRTYIGPDQLRPNQVELLARTKDFCDQQRAVTEYFKNVARLAIGSSNGAGEALADILGMGVPAKGQVEEAIAKLDALCSSDLWLEEVARSRANRQRAAAGKQDMLPE